MGEKKPKKVFVQGAISPKKIANSIAHHQVRADIIDGKKVVAIDYSAYEEMAELEFHKIREEAFSKFNLTCMHIYHSIGPVKTGEICLFVFTSSAHRKEAMDACRFIVEEIKAKVPVFGKEVLEDKSFVWKENKE
mgnify:CR=1 FL=1